MPTLEPEQVYGADWLGQDYSRLLGDIPGLGKTAQAIMGARNLGAQRMVVVCPAVARVNWERELVMWGWEHPIVRVSEKADHALPHPHAPQAVIVSYDGLAGSKKLRGALNAGLWDVLVLDEGHRLKEATASRTKAVYGNRIDATKCLAEKAMYRWLLTGSPMPNNAGELWTHLHALWPELIRNSAGRALAYEDFLGRYCRLKHTQYGVKIMGYRDRDALLEMLRSIMLRRTNIKGLPGLVLREEPTLVEVDNAELKALEASEEFEALKAVLESAKARSGGLEGIEDEFIHLATLRRLTGTLIAAPAAEIIGSEIGQGDKVVVFAIHRETIDILEEGLVTFRPAVVHGGVPDGKRNEEIDRFNQDPKCQVFIGQIEVCKEVINLQAANRVRLVEESWCPETNAQAIARVWRRGQKQQVFADAIAIAGSISETVSKVLLHKTRLVQSLMKEDFTHE